MANENSELQSTDWTISKPRIKRKYQTYFKLIDLYRERECLWKESHKDFINFELKECAWEEIANEMTDPVHPIPNVDKWKQLIHTIRYKVQLEQLREQKAKFFNQEEELPPKLCYSNKFRFLLKHMFDRQEQKLQKSTTTIPLDNAEEMPQESLAAKCMRMGREKVKTRVSFSHKLKVLENLRNRRRSTLSLTPEAFDKLKSTGRNRFT